MQVLEKAWAKVNANYNNINSGSSGEVWSFLAGIPSRYYPMTDVSSVNSNSVTLWNMVNEAMKKNQIVSLGTPQTTSFGLVPGHAYTVLGSFNYTTQTQETNLLFQIRNPWGKDVYDDS
jgi:hypothetical protein